MSITIDTVGTKILADDVAVVWTEDGRAEYQRMAYHVASLASVYGPTSKWATEAATSFAKISASMSGWGDVRVSRDGYLSLFCRTNSIVFGLIFHPVRRSCTVDGCPMYANNEGKTYHYRLSSEIQVQLHKHQWLYGLDQPIPGTWSFHS